MEIRELLPFVQLIVLIGVLLGVGILILDGFGSQVRVNTPVVNESIAITSLTGATTNDDVISASYFGNSTLNCVLPDTACANITTAGGVTANATFVDATYDISYRYWYDSVGTVAMASMVSAIAPIAATWLPLIVTVAVLAIILTLVITSFAGRRK